MKAAAWNVPALGRAVLAGNGGSSQLAQQRQEKEELQAQISLQMQRIRELEVRCVCIVAGLDCVFCTGAGRALPQGILNKYI